MKDKPEVEDIIVYVSRRLNRVKTAEILKWNEHEHEILIGVWKYGQEHFTNHKFNPAIVRRSARGYTVMLEILIDETILRLGSYVDGLRKTERVQHYTNLQG